MQAISFKKAFFFLISDHTALSVEIANPCHAAFSVRSPVTIPSSQASQLKPVAP
jgi:hypothetical protein